MLVLGYLYAIILNFLRALIKGKNTRQIYDKPIPYKTLRKEFEKYSLTLLCSKDFYTHYPLRRKLPNNIKKIFDTFFEFLNRFWFNRLYLFLVFKKVNLNEK